VREANIKKLTIKTETLRQLKESELAEAAGGITPTGLCRYTLQVPSCVGAAQA
jgi:hypothetical protein